MLFRPFVSILLTSLSICSSPARPQASAGPLPGSDVRWAPGQTPHTEINIPGGTIVPLVLTNPVWNKFVRIGMYSLI
jgi:hypothetical protein